MTSESCGAAARQYLARGWQPLPIPAGSKAPTLRDWPNFRVNGDGAKFFSGPGNLGIPLGEPSGGLVDIDLDAPETLVLAKYFLPKTDAIFGRASKPQSHWLYTVAPTVKTAKFQDPTCPGDKAMLVEVRSRGAAAGGRIPSSRS